MSIAPRLRFLTSKDEDLIHEKCLHILANRGVNIDYPRGLEVLKLAGADVHAETETVRFSRSQIEEALKTAPRSFKVKGSDPRPMCFPTSTRSPCRPPRTYQTRRRMSTR